MHRRVGSNGLVNHQRRPSGNQPFQLSNQMIAQSMNQSFNPSIMHSPDSQFSRSSSVTTSNSSTPMNRYSNQSINQPVNQSSIYTQLNAAQSMLKEIKRTARTSDQFSNQSSPYLSSAQSTNQSLASLNQSMSQSAINAALNPGINPMLNPQPTTNLKVKRKLRKNTREKQRRYELNDKFDNLQELLNLGNGATKVEKYTILSEAISTIMDLRKNNSTMKSENRELKQQLKSLHQSIDQLSQNGQFSSADLERLLANRENMSPVNNQSTSQSSSQSNVLNFIAKITSNQGSPTSQSMNHSSSMSMVSSPTAASSSPVNPSLFQPNPLPSPTSFMNMNFHQPAEGLIPQSSPVNQSNNQSKPPHHRRGSSNNFAFASISSNPFANQLNQSMNPSVNPLMSPTTFGGHKRQNSLLAQTINNSINQSFGMHHRAPSVKDEFGRYSSLVNQLSNQPISQSINQMSISPTHADMHAFAFPTSAMHGQIEQSMNPMNQSFPTAAMISQISQQVAMNALQQQQQLQQHQAMNPSFNSGHRHQSSQDFKFGMATGSPATSPRAGFNHLSNQSNNPLINHIPMHRHNRSLSQNNHFNFNLNVNLDGLNDLPNPALNQFGLTDLNALSAYSVLPFDSPSTLYQHQRHQEVNDESNPSLIPSSRAFGMEEDEQAHM